MAVVKCALAAAIALLARCTNAGAGALSVVAGRLLCDTYLSAREVGWAGLLTALLCWPREAD